MYELFYRTKTRSTLLQWGTGSWGHIHSSDL